MAACDREINRVDSKVDANKAACDREIAMLKAGFAELTANLMTETATRNREKAEIYGHLQALDDLVPEFKEDIVMLKEDIVMLKGAVEMIRNPSAMRYVMNKLSTFCALVGVAGVVNRDAFLKLFADIQDAVNMQQASCSMNALPM